MTIELNLDVDVKWKNIPESEGTTDEILPASVDVYEVTITKNGKTIDITSVLSETEIEYLKEIIED